MGLRSMATDTERTERPEPDLETTMDGGLCRLDAPGVAELEDDERVVPRHAREDD
jgi:hypothetical protein